MSPTTRSEVRIELQRFDEGDPDDTVWARPNGPSACVYHADEECAASQAGGGERHTEAKPITRALAKNRWHAPCFDCVLEGEALDAAREYRDEERAE